MSLVAPILAMLALWWISTGAILVLGERSVLARRLAMVLVSALSIAALAGVWLLRDITTPMAAYAGAAAALAAVLLASCLSGPRIVAGLPDDDVLFDNDDSATTYVFGKHGGHDTVFFTNTDLDQNDPLSEIYFEDLGLDDVEITVGGHELYSWSDEIIQYNDVAVEAVETGATVVLPGVMIALFDWNPLFHMIDQMRGFVFVNYEPHFTNWQFPVQATLVMLALQAAATAGGPIDMGGLPDLDTLMRPTMEEENEQFPVFANAPRLIRETLLFPYLSGAGFVQSLFRHRSNGGPPVPFGDLLPQSTEQVLHPERAFIGVRDVPTEITLGDGAGAWSVAYSNTLGQLETSILLRELLGDATATSAGGWDGDRYALLRGPGGEEARLTRPE